MPLLIKTVPEQPKNPPITWRAAISQVAIQFGATFFWNQLADSKK